MIRSSIARLTAVVAGLAAATAGMLALAVAPASAATTFTVDDATDTGAAVPANCTTPVAGACRLVDALAAADATNGDVVISLAVPGGVIAATGDSYNGGVGGTHSLTIEGNGQTIADANANIAISLAAGSSATISDVTITSKFTAITSNVPTTVTNSTLHATVTTTKTTAQGYFGGKTAPLTLSGSVVVAENQNDGDAVAITSPAPLSISSSTVSAASAAADGQAVVATDGSATVTASTITASGATDSTGIEASSGAVHVVNSTITGVGGNGIDNPAGTTTLVDATIWANGQGTGRHNLVTQNLDTFGSVIGGAASGNTNCTVSGTTTSAYDWSDDADGASSCLLADGTDHVGASGSPMLGALGDNGGATQTLLPATGSPLIDAIPSAHCQDGLAAGITADQRGITRPQKTGCDIGAVEVQAATPVVATTPAPVTIQPNFTG